MLIVTPSSGVAFARPWHAEPASGVCLAYRSGTDAGMRVDAFPTLDPKQRPSAPRGWAT